MKWNLLVFSSVFFSILFLETNLGAAGWFEPIKRMAPRSSISLPNLASDTVLEPDCNDLEMSYAEQVDLAFNHLCLYETKVTSPAVPSGLPSLLILAGIRVADGAPLPATHGMQVRIKNPSDNNSASTTVCRKASWDNWNRANFGAGFPLDIGIASQRSLRITLDPSRTISGDSNRVNNQIYCTGLESAPHHDPFSGLGCLLSDALKSGYTGVCPVIDESTTIGEYIPPKP